MKTKLLFLILLFTITRLNAQSTYNSANYAINGDVFYLTNATNLTTDYTTTGANFNWNFGTLTGNSQDKLQFRNPTATGFSIFTFPYIFNPNNTNLSSTDGTSNVINAFGQTIGIINTNDYFKKTTSQLKQVASSFKLNYNGANIPIQNQYSSPDIIYNFPINFNNTDTSNSGYTTNIPSIYYQSKAITRTNLVDGWGTITTPHGTFTNTLRITSTIIENDSTAIGGIGLPRIIRTSRELKWLDVTKKYPVLIVTQNNAAGNWITSKVQFMDVQRNFQTTALFVYSPFTINAGDTVNFQNLSTNGTTYNWSFGDSSSGTLNSSALENPNHIFNTDGIYQVVLTVSNSSFTDTITIPVVVGNVLANTVFIEKNELKAFPNPFTNNINVSKEFDSSNFILTNIQGEILYKGTKISNQNFDYLSSGVYFLQVFNDEKSFIGKLLKK